MLPPTLSIVSDPSTPQAELLALLAVPQSAMSVGAARNRVATSAWWPVVETREWNCGTQCEMWGVPLVCLFHNPELVSIVAPLELGLGTHATFFLFLGKCSMGRFPLQNLSKASNADAQRRFVAVGTVSRVGFQGVRGYSISLR